MRPAQYEKIVFQALEYIKSHLPSSISVPEIAHSTGFCPRHVCQAFHRVLHESVAAHVLRLRVERAMELLRVTNLTITEVAFEAGFNSYTHFAKTFRNRTGQTPNQYRKQATEPPPLSPGRHDGVELGRARPDLRYVFSGPELGPDWSPLSGKWRILDRAIAGGGAEDFRLALNRPLPENFRLSLRARISVEGLNGGHLLLDLQDEQGSRTFCEFAVASTGFPYGELRQDGGEKWSTNAVVQEGVWTWFTVEFIHDRLRLLIEQKEVFAVRCSFVPPYAMRSRFVFGAWRLCVEMDEFQVQDKGFLWFAPTIRQGDAFYALSLFSKAREFFTRYLETGPAGPEEAMELRYKIGMCFLREGEPEQARRWLEMVVPAAKEDFWWLRSQLGRLETWAARDDTEGLIADIKTLFGDKSTIEDARMIAHGAAKDLGGRGFHEKAIAVFQALCDQEAPGSIYLYRARTELALEYLRVRAHRDAQELLQQLVQDAPDPVTSLTHQCTLFYALTVRGKIAESEQSIVDLCRRTRDPFLLLRAELARATNLRARGRIDEAVGVLKAIPEKFPISKEQGAFALFTASTILAAIGQTPRAEELIAAAGALCPQSAGMGRARYAVAFLSGRFEAAASILTQAAANESSSDDAEAAIKAGILTEIAGRPGEAKEIWTRVARRFPAERYRFYSDLAIALSRDNGEEAEERMPFPAMVRAEFFLLLAGLHRARGNQPRERRLLQRCIEEDPTQAWPALAAKRELNGGTA